MTDKQSVNPQIRAREYSVPSEFSKEAGMALRMAEHTEEVADTISCLAVMLEESPEFQELVSSFAARIGVVVSYTDMSYEEEMQRINRDPGFNKISDRTSDFRLFISRIFIAGGIHARLFPSRDVI